MKKTIVCVMAGVAIVSSLGCQGVHARENEVKAKTGGASMEFLQRSYHLGSYNQKSNPMWEFVTGKETVDNWTSLLTLIERNDASSKEELDRLAQGILTNYKSRNGQILLAKTMVGKAGQVFNYMAVAFEDPAQHRFELSFTKVALGSKSAYVLVYGVRIGDPDYLNKAKAFLNEHSSEIGRALENAALPDLGSLPRKEF